MHLFYYPEIKGNTFTLDKPESAHCIKVLRLTTGDIIHLTNGAGKLFMAKIIKPDKKACTSEILEVYDIPKKQNSYLHIGIAPTKNIERFEWFLEKATEIGTDKFTPLLCNNSERRIIKELRLQKVIISAMKQSLKAWLPEITPLTTFEDLVNRDFQGSKYIATCKAPPDNHIGKIHKKNTNSLILIGPEGDFRKEEVEMALDKGYVPVSLGESRLRTETAGLVACHSINFINSVTGT